MSILEPGESPPELVPRDRPPRSALSKGVLSGGRGFITAPNEPAKILNLLVEPTEPPVISPARGPPQYDLFDDAA